MSATHEVIFRADQVLLVTDGHGGRSPIHIVHVKKGQVCWADGPKGREQWESATAFMRRDPVVVGSVVRNFWRGLSYDYDRNYERRDKDERLVRAESERRAMLESYNKANQRCVDLEAALDAIAKSARRDENQRQWVIRDDLLFHHDTRGKAREVLPR